MVNIFTKHHENQSEEQKKEEAPGPSKRKFIRSSDEESERGRKRITCSIEDHAKHPGSIRPRSTEDERQGGSKRAKMSSSKLLGLETERKKDDKEQLRGQKRLRDSDDDEEPQQQKMARTSSSKKSGQKRSRDSDDVEEPRQQKMATTSSSKEPVRKRLRDSDDVEEPRQQKMAKTSSREPVRKRSRETDEEEEQYTQKRVKICPENVAGQVVDYSNTSFSQSLNSYEIQKVLGQGNFGRVMLALHKKTNHLVAIKEIVKRSVPARAIGLEQRLLEMARGCPFLNHGLTAFHNRRNTYLVMEYVQGGSLHDFLAKKGVLNMDESRFIAAELICGIQFLHSHSVIHRDLKPENTLMSHEGHVKIADFGLAAENIVGSNKEVGRYGTLKYMAPEVLDDKEYGCSADWWSLGVMICQMITGQYPFNEKDTEAEYRWNVLTAHPCYPEWLSTDPRDLLNRLLDKNPKSRLGFTRNIRKHCFFTDIDWKELELCKVRPPYLMTT